MANLIPPQAKRNIFIEYWIRVASIWLILLGAAALMYAALNVPVYILIQNQFQTYDSLYADASAQNTSFDKIEADIVIANDTATLLATARKTETLMPLVDEIESLADDKIVIENIQMARTGTVLEKIQISGTAVDRESLVRFSDAIEATERIETAEIPLSNLAKDSDIPFTINAVLKVSEN